MMMRQTIEKSEGDRELLSQLWAELKKEGHIAGGQVVEVRLPSILCLVLNELHFFVRIFSYK